MRRIQKDWIEMLGVKPFPLRTLLSVLGDYSQPIFKVHQLVKSGVLIRLKRGWFCLAPEITRQTIPSQIVANELYEAPSYISLEYALSYYGLIPERAMGVTSVVMGRSKRFETPIGWFSYRTLPEKLFGFGVDSRDAYLIATPEKALCDYLFTRENLRISSPRALREYLEEDVRFDFDSFEHPDRTIFAAYTASGYKKNLFSALERLFQ